MVNLLINILLHLHVRKFSHSLASGAVSCWRALKPVLPLLLALGIGELAGLPISTSVLSLRNVLDSLVLIGAS